MKKTIYYICNCHKIGHTLCCNHSNILSPFWYNAINYKYQIQKIGLRLSSMRINSISSLCQAP